MKDININVKKLFKTKTAGNIIILAAAMLLIYLLASLYFINHFFFNTRVNGVNVSLRSHAYAENMLKNFVNDYKLQLVERDGKSEEIIGQDIKMQYNEKNSISNIYHRGSQFKWMGSLLKNRKYYVEDLYSCDEDCLRNKISELNCLNNAAVEPQNVSFKYYNGSYEIIKEVYGNKIDRDRLDKAVKLSILGGETKLDLNEKLCYVNPKYTVSSPKTLETKSLLDKYVKARITYVFDSKKEVLEGNTISKWLSVDEDLEPVISEKAAMSYVRGLCKKYDTVGIARNFKTSIGKIVEVKGGLYGWKINYVEETKALLENIEFGETIEKEPVYIQKALSRGDHEIGDTYVEINITRQHLWFYKDGKLVIQGDVVTGNPSRGYSTVLGTYMLNYKQKGAALTGPDYEAEVTYWMPFFGNIGIHDASWRYSFGGEIYKRNGTHGCINAPLYLAKMIFDNIEDGTPIICYEE